jgi:hypothetical protein
VDHVDEDYGERKQSEKWNAEDAYWSYNRELHNK